MHKLQESLSEEFLLGLIAAIFQLVFGIDVPGFRVDVARVKNR